MLLSHRVYPDSVLDKGDRLTVYHLTKIFLTTFTPFSLACDYAMLTELATLAWVFKLLPFVIDGHDLLPTFFQSRRAYFLAYDGLVGAYPAATAILAPDYA